MDLHVPFFFFPGNSWCTLMDVPLSCVMWRGPSRTLNIRYDIHKENFLNLLQVFTLSYFVFHACFLKFPYRIVAFISLMLILVSWYWNQCPAWFQVSAVTVLQCCNRFLAFWFITTLYIMSNIGLLWLHNSCNGLWCPATLLLQWWPRP